MKFLIVAAKTGGHIYPAKVISQELKERGHEIFLLGIGNQIEENAFKDLNSKIYKLKIEGFRGQTNLKKLKVLGQVVINVFKVLGIIKKENIDVMIGFGGFITLPAGIASWLRGKPIFIHEQNAVIGSANKILSKISKKTFIGFPLENSDKDIKTILTGNPIRKINPKKFGSIHESDNQVKIYVTGGSQGSEFINETIPKVLLKLSNNIKIKHQCGKSNLNLVDRLYKSADFDFEVKEFYENPFKEILWSDFVISRAGALTLSEIISLKRGALIIPLPSSIDNHQVLNAESIQRMNLGITHYQEESLEKLVTRLKSIIDNKTYMSWKKLGLDIHINASKMILDIIEDYEFK